MASELFERETRRCLAELYVGEGKSRVECEAVLPDYKEAAHRVLRVETKSRVNRKNTYLQGSQLICEIEGVITFQILYLSERKGEVGVPCSFMAQENFSWNQKIPLPEESVNAEEILTAVEVRPEKASYKLLGPRKILLRSDAVISLNLKYNREIPLYVREPRNDIKAKKTLFSSAKLVTVHQENVVFSETICLPKGAVAIGEICEMDVDLFCEKIVPCPGGVTVKGNCDLHCTYLAEDESLISFDQPIEFEKSLGIPAVTEDHFCQIHLEPDFLKAATEVNEEGENKNIQFEIGFSAEVSVFENEETDLICDAFSTTHQLELKKEETVCDKISAMAPFSLSRRGEKPLPEAGILRVEALRCHMDLKDSYWEEGSVVLEGKVTFRFVGVMEDGKWNHYEMQDDFKGTLPSDLCPLPDGAEECRVEISGGIRGGEMSPGSDGISFRYDYCGQVTLFARKKTSVVSSIVCGEAEEKKERGVVFCYPEEGESLWNLCKEYRIDPDEVCRENGCDQGDTASVLRLIL